MHKLQPIHLTKEYRSYFLSFMINKIEKAIYDLMATGEVARYTSKIATGGGRSPKPAIETLNVQKIHELQLGEGPKSIDIAGELAYVTSMKSARLDVFDIVQGEKIEEITLPGMPVEVVVDPGRRLVLVSEMGKGEGGVNSVCGINMGDNQIEFQIPTEGLWSKFMALRPGSPELWVSNWLSNNVSVIDLDKRQLLTRFSAGRTPRGIAFTPDGKFGYVCGYYSRDVMKFDAETKEQTGRILMPFSRLSYQGTPRHIIIDKGGEFAYVSNMGRGTVHQLDLATDRITATVYEGKRVSTLNFNPLQNLIACANDGEQNLTLLQPRSLQVVNVIPTKGHGFGVDFDQSGKYLASVAFDTRLMEVFKLT